MSTDIASLTIEINSEQVKEAKADLKDFSDETLRTVEDVDRFQKKINDTAAFNKRKEAMAADREVMKEVPKDIQKILDKYDPLGTKLRQLESDYAALDKAILGSSRETAQTKAFVGLNAEIAKTKELMVAAGAASGPGFEKAAVGAMNLGLNTAYARRELVTLGREAVSGDFSRLPNTFTSLVAHSNLLSVLFNPITAGILALTAGAGLLAVAWVKGAEEQEHMNRAMQITNDYAGVTRGSMLSLADSVSRSSTMTVGATKEIVTSMVESGRVGTAVLGAMVRLVDDFASATGQSAGKASQELIKIFDDPARGAEELNKQFHFLTAAEIDHIEHLQRMGLATQAQLELSQKLSDFLPKHADNLGVIERSWNAVKKAASSAWDAMLNVGRDATLEQQLAAAQKYYFSLQASNDPDSVDLETARQRYQDLIVKVIKMQDDAAQKGVRAEREKADIASDSLAKQYSKYAEIQKINDEIVRLTGMVTLPGSDQDIYRSQAIRELKKKRDDLINPNDLLKNTRTALRDQADADIARIHEWTNKDDSRTLQGVEAVNQVEDRFDRASGDFAAREEAKREEVRKTKEVEKQAHEQGAYQEELDYQAMVKAAAARTKHEGQIAQFNETMTQSIDQLAQEGKQYNESKLEIAMATEARKIENAYRKAAIGLSKDELAELDKTYEVKKRQAADAVAQSVASKEMLEEQKRLASQALKIWDNFVENIQRTLGTELYEIMDGNFKNIASSFANMLKRMLADSLAADLTQAVFGNRATATAAPGWFAALIGLGATAKGTAGGIGGIGAVSAKGSYYNDGMAYFADGGLVNAPTKFQYASGGQINNGLMGEAGPEAIMPLKRDSSGRLGVSGGGGGKQISVVYAPVYHIDSRTDRAQIISEMDKRDKAAQAELTDKLQRAGAI